MTPSTEKTIERKFIFEFSAQTSNETYQFEVPIHIPFVGNINELSQRLITLFKVPVYIEKDLEAELKLFVEQETLSYLDNIAVDAIKRGQNGEVDVEEIIKNFERLFKEETAEYAAPRGSTDEELFATVYHKLVHSPALEAMLQVEHAYSIVVNEMTTQRDDELAALTERQGKEMSHLVSGIGDFSTEAEVNSLAARHCEDQNMVQAKINSQIDSLQETQRREYREWLMKLLEEQAEEASSVTPPTPSPTHIVRHITTEVSSKEKKKSSSDAKADVPSNPSMEESFTIHLGSQMKQMHNIRIMSADVLHLCKTHLSANGVKHMQPQRLQTALALYSNDLCGLVLLTDGLISSYSGTTKEFINVCQQSTEFHFPPIDDQLEKIREGVKETASWRQEHWGSENLSLSGQQWRRASSAGALRTGDVYVTRHSNLNEVHVVFHMVIDDSLRSSDMNSRHPAILGLRNVLKMACSNDVTTLTVPLLLAHHMTEEMTVAWCAKRAELVLKCVKGFMIEMASWGGSELKNLQFVVPEGISDEVFVSLAAMLPSVFRVSNPLVFKASSAPITPKTA
ncbi:Protein C12orf4-like protein [Frankliniella fusca]|uniref:Protein C12orf4-like protein n=1 Tax=Frankliniella fusca TaxID=407009 RepID=A0AAE1HKH5_9NEOP|nr:Protein C12orf4-like protein [Frankliniella fusca]